MSSDFEAEETKIFTDILTSLCVDSFDSKVVLALSEYGRRFTSDLLCDAKDYATHAQREEISSDDVRVAIKLCDQRPVGTGCRLRMIEEVQQRINAQDILDSIDKEAAIIRYPSNAYDGLTQRTFTYVTGQEAYGEASMQAKSKLEGKSLKRKEVGAVEADSKSKLWKSGNRDFRGGRKLSKSESFNDDSDGVMDT